MVFSTQQGINIAGIKDGVIVMKDGSYRLLLQVAATNFALKSEQEQNSIIFQYQSFLNSLHFSIEIVVSSRRLDLSPYIAKIKKISETQQNELLKMQTLDYVDFLEKLIDIANIMKKTFYVVVSYHPITLKKSGLLGSLFGQKSLFDHVRISEDEFKAHTAKLKEQASTVASGLGSMGLHCFQLSTENLIELFYLYYNPDEAAKEVVKDATQLSSPIIMHQSEFNDTETDPKTNEQPAPEGGMIDNSSVVQAQRKQEAEAIRQENLKEAEKTVRTQPEQKTQPTAAAQPQTGTASQAETVPLQQTPQMPSPEQPTAQQAAQPNTQPIQNTEASPPTIPNQSS